MSVLLVEREISILKKKLKYVNFSMDYTILSKKERRKFISRKVDILESVSFWENHREKVLVKKIA